MSGRRVWIAPLPEMRLACFEVALPLADVPDDDLAPEFGALWDSFNEWRVHARPELGRIDIAAIGWQELQADGETVVYRAGVPVRSDYRAPAPARMTRFPGGAFAYCYADTVEEIPGSFRTVFEHLQAEAIRPVSGPIEVYKFHYNLEQHPADCGVLVDVELVRSASHDAPLPIAR